jgi:hypothetical protein
MLQKQTIKPSIDQGKALFVDQSFLSIYHFFDAEDKIKNLRQFYLYNKCNH